MTLSLEEQLSFEGMPVAQVRAKVGASKDFDCLVDGDRITLRHGDRVRVEMTCVVDAVEFGEKHNGVGISIGPLRRTHTLSPLTGTVELRSVMKREEVQAEWARRLGHGG